MIAAIVVIGAVILVIAPTMAVTMKMITTARVVTDETEITSATGHDILVFRSYDLTGAFPRTAVRHDDPIQDRGHDSNAYSKVNPNFP
ncbi:hypothetical protein F2Q68_00027413 [Brassica cretica]|uniref:Uncharacterized protein n=1 Tax=Brassica cretica TaxID=69181 RepID=A0A8S9IAR2_BRACR|nr:hypothetical protein F2Q68_00027413 [Brassica cretica]